MKLRQWAILIYVSLNQTDCLELYRHYEWEKEPHTEHIKGPTISLDRGTMGRGVEIKKGDNRGEEMVAADRTDKKKWKKGEKKRRGPRHWPHRAEGSQSLWMAYTWS